jgi:hypothetical protein
MIYAGCIVNASPVGASGAGSPWHSVELLVALAARQGTLWGGFSENTQCLALNLQTFVGAASVETS